MTRPMSPGEQRQEPVVLGDRYELTALLGRGGMAEVHRAHDRLLGRQVAVKLLLPERRDEGVDARRLQDEARAAASLSHPNVVAVHDVGSSPQGIFVVMEHLAGRTWRADIREQGRLPEADVCRVGAAVAEALAAAHERGIVHRDVNPANVMIQPDGTPKLMDFGLARVVDVGGLTETGVVIGTAAYMSPEQVRDEELDGRSDVYSLGCSLYEALTGEVPFIGNGTADTASLRLRESPLPPRRRVPGLSAASEDVVLRSLSREPAARPSASQVAAALRDLAEPRGAGRTRGGAGPDERTTTRLDGPGTAAVTTVRVGEGTTADVGTDADTAPPSGERAAPGGGLRLAGRALIVLGAIALVVAVVLLVLAG